MLLKFSEEGAVVSMILNTLRFGGKDEDPYEWTCCIEKFFASRNVPEDHRTAMMFYHLEGETLAWFKWLEMNSLLTTWSSFLQMVKFHFGSKFEDPETRLLKLSQVGSVTNYQSEFDEIRSKVTRMHEAMLISLYISGLKFHIRKALQLNRPCTIEDAYALARRFEKECHESQDKAQVVEQGVNGVSRVFTNSTEEPLECMKTKPTQEPLFCTKTEEGVENMKVVVDSKLEAEFVEVSACEFGYKMDTNATNFVLQFETIWKGRIRPLDAKFIEDFPRYFALVLEEKSTIVGGIYSIVVRKKGAVLTLYALKEVYKEFLSLHLEDNVVLKG